MANTVRFIELVKQCGQPVTMTLWTKPEANPALQKAIKENRVLTIGQAKGAKKDFGTIGFVE
jgi:hypothetical protein